MRIGVVILPQERWSVSRQHWLEAEQLGFDHAWTYDHLAWRSLADQPWFATVPLLAAAGALTSTIGLGTWVASPNFRHPVPFAKDVMGLDDVTGGRLLLGLGAGGEGFDARVLGPAPTRGERTSRFEEFVALLDTLLTRPVTDHTGRWYTANDARMVPGTIAVPRTPFVVAANGPRTMALAARFGQGWTTYGPVPPDERTAAAQDQWWAGLAELVAVYDEIEAAAGRREPARRYLSIDGAPVFSLESVETAVEGVHRAAELGFTDVVLHRPRADGVYAGSLDTYRAFAERLPELQRVETTPRR
ncbi:MAG: luciferase [Cellulomonas sp. 14-74-6]|jgi:alkanesulfonate monooxygenase SsuD/methylene tetrahydromethanopterin reductase-like flavin-dependent oxidoreductase (luciferase family)|nr:MAG: luciferase [Cellulomonas sp. 14-74-6]